MMVIPEGFEPLTFKLFEVLDEGDLIWKNGQYGVIEEYNTYNDSWPLKHLPNRDDIRESLTSRYLENYYVYTKGIKRLHPFDPLEGLITGDTVRLKGSGVIAMKKHNGSWIGTSGAGFTLHEIRYNMVTPPYVLGEGEFEKCEGMNLNLYEWVDKLDRTWYHNGRGWYIEGHSEWNGLAVLNDNYAPFRRKDCLN